MAANDASFPVVTVSEAKELLSRRRMIAGIGGVVAGGLLTGTAVKQFTDASMYQPLLDLGDHGGRALQRALMSVAGRPLAPEYRLDQASPVHPSNGGFGANYIDPDPRYDALLASGFESWRLQVDGLVQRPGRFSLDQMRAMPHRTQVTMHCCDQGWSAIGQWSGVPLGWLLQYVGILDKARYVVFYAMDKIQGTGLFDSIDLFDAFHPQTMLADRMNGAPLPKRHGAPLRLRLELQVGYKNLKHIDRIEVVESLQGVGHGRGGLFQQFGFQWYAGQ
jgi:DMSO/TMAO reductase YedYZ molybdopterin-dependent catalytic subunit